MRRARAVLWLLLFLCSAQLPACARADLADLAALEWARAKVFEEANVASAPESTGKPEPVPAEDTPWHSSRSRSGSGDRRSRSPLDRGWS